MMQVRSQVTATYFAIIGNVCKVISVIINYLMWDKHATPIGTERSPFDLCRCTRTEHTSTHACISSLPGLGFLGLSLIAAYFYEQAPLREDSLDFENTEAPEEPAVCLRSNRINRAHKYIQPLSTTAPAHCNILSRNRVATLLI